MPQAKQIPITSPGLSPDTDRPTVVGQSSEMQRALSAASLIPASAPTVATLGAHLADVERALYCYGEDHFSEHGQDAVDAMWARQVLEERAEGLRTVIGTMTATTLLEAAIQTAIIPHFSERISSLNSAQSELAGEVIERLVLSVLPIVAGHANMNMEDMGWHELVRLRLSRFAGVGVQS